MRARTRLSWTGSTSLGGSCYLFGTIPPDEPSPSGSDPLAARIREIVLAMAPVVPGELPEDPLLVAELGFTSLDLMELLFAFEDELDVELADRVQGREIDRLSQIVSRVRELKSSGDEGPASPLA